ncbi:hypothetical protein KFE25_013335 [Diacronema lutheri]|uniref:J domain-containing protein n=2 Tax=Diacronema lutheri TaxID=2081491 RepID=A0A8J5XTK8_DIALT|nr:hypothetical protein KFE25_013335 [Diacronema lutheri]
MARSRGSLLLGALWWVSGTAADYYADLGVSRRATAEEIKTAYRTLAKQLHPDKSNAPDADARFAKIATAYETLSNPDTRRQYDAYGPAYAASSGAARAGASAGRQRDPFAEFFAHGSRGQGFGFGGYSGAYGSAARPSFSSTIELDNDNWDHLVGAREAGEVRLWLVCFYADSSDLSRRFGMQWEALAARLQPMVRLGRVNTESRSAWMVVRRYRQLLMRVPAVVMVGDDGGDSSRATAYYGSTLSAELLAEWARRFLPAAQALRVASTRQLDEFVRAAAREPGEGGAGGPEARVPVLVLSSHASHDSLLVRYLAHRFVTASEDGGIAGGNGGARIALAHALVAQHTADGSAAARVMQAVGARELPAVAIWRDGPRGPPEVYSLAGAAAQPAGAGSAAAARDADAAAAGLADEAAQRARLVRLVRTRGSPRLRKLRASNMHDMCAAPARAASADGRTGGCALIICDSDAGRCAAAARLALDADALLRADADAEEGEPRVLWALLDGVRQQPLVRALLTAPSAAAAAAAAAGTARVRGVRAREQAPPPPAGSLPAGALPAIALLLPAADGRGALASARWAVYGGALAPAAGADARALAAWVEGVLGGKARAERSAELPPLLADRPPGLGARLWSAVFGSSLDLGTKCAIAAVLVLGTVGVTLLTLARSQPRKPPPAGGGSARAAGRGDDTRSEQSADVPPAGGAGAQRAGAGGHGSADGGAEAHAGNARDAPGGGQQPRASEPAAGASPFDAPALSARSLAAALGAAPFCIVVPQGSAKYSNSGCTATVRVLRARYSAEGSFYFATLHVHEQDAGNVVFRQLQLVLRQCGCVALRRTSDIERTRVAVYNGPMSPDALGSWLDRLIGGELPLAHLLGGS